MASIRYLFACAATLLICGSAYGQLSPARLCVLQRAQHEIGVKEIGKTNSGPRVNQYLNASGNNPGEFWCAAFITWCYKGCDIKTPAQPGAARNYFHPGPTLLYQRGKFGKLEAGQPGDVVGYFYVNLNRIGHIGMVEQIKDNCIFTIEGNTGADGSRDGDGVWRKRRMKRTIYALANHIRK